MKDDSISYKDLQELLYWNIDKLQEKDKEIEELKLELSGYRQAILQDKEMLGLKEEVERLHSIIKALNKYFEEHEQYEDNEFLRQLESCTEKDTKWLKKMGGE